MYIPCRVRYVYPLKLFISPGLGKIKKHLWSSFTFLVLSSVVSSQKPTERSRKNAARSVCTRFQAYTRASHTKYMRMRGKHVGNATRVLTFDRLVSLPKNELRTSICGCGQRAFTSSVQTMLEKKRMVRHSFKKWNVINSVSNHLIFSISTDLRHRTLDLRQRPIDLFTRDRPISTAIARTLMGIDRF